MSLEDGFEHCAPVAKSAVREPTSQRNSGCGLTTCASAAGAQACARTSLRSALSSEDEAPERSSGHLRPVGCMRWLGCNLAHESYNLPVFRKSPQLAAMVAWPLPTTGRCASTAAVSAAVLARPYNRRHSETTIGFASWRRTTIQMIRIATILNASQLRPRRIQKTLLRSAGRRVVAA
jgi:hypothetical protein